MSVSGDFIPGGENVDIFGLAGLVMAVICACMFTNVFVLVKDPVRRLKAWKKRDTV